MSKNVEIKIERKINNKGYVYCVITTTSDTGFPTQIIPDASGTRVNRYNSEPFKNCKVLETHIQYKIDRINEIVKEVEENVNSIKNIGTTTISL